MEVHRTLGPGFIESIYKNALTHELRLGGMEVQTEMEVQILYRDCVVGRHRMDLIVDGQVIVELKAVATLADVHIAQAVSYMTATGLAVSLVVNFGEPSLRWKRLVKTRK